MRTEAQKEASRRNGAKSRGPISLAGKRTVSTNAQTHSVLTNAITLKCELKQSFLNIIEALHREFQPQSPFEESLLEMMAAARWQYSRIWCMFSAGMDHEMDRQAAAPDPPQDQWAACSWLSFKSLGDTSRTLDLMLRYETHYSRQYLRAHRRLMEVRGHRNPPAPGPFLVPRPIPPAKPTQISCISDEAAPAASQTAASEATPAASLLFSERLPQPDPEKTPIAEQTRPPAANKASLPAPDPATQNPPTGRALTRTLRPRPKPHSPMRDNRLILTRTANQNASYTQEPSCPPSSE